MRIAILGATSQIAKDLIVGFATAEEHELYLFARRPEAVAEWLAAVGMSGRYPVHAFAAFGQQTYDAIINFVGVGNPAQSVVMGNSIFDITLEFDQLAMSYLSNHPTCRYLFLSSGAAYGSRFDTPVKHDSPAVICFNQLSPQEWYGVAKLHAECRHRAHPEWAIIDIRVFNYFSCTQDIAARFLITDMLRAIRDNVTLKTSPDYIVRDYLHPKDFYQLVQVLLAGPPDNAVVDCYSQAPIDKPGLLEAMQQQFGLRYKISGCNPYVNATGNKPYYYSLNTRAADFGYQPSMTALESVIQESQKILNKLGRH